MNFNLPNGIINNNNERRVYESTHKHSKGGWGSFNPIPNDKIGQKVIDEGMYVEGKKQLYSYYEGDIIEFQPSGNVSWHGYAVKNTADECLKEMAKILKDKGIIVNSEKNH